MHNVKTSILRETTETQPLDRHTNAHIEEECIINVCQNTDTVWCSRQGKERENTASQEVERVAEKQQELYRKPSFTQLKIHKTETQQTQLPQMQSS